MRDAWRPALLEVAPDVARFFRQLAQTCIDCLFRAVFLHVRVALLVRWRRVHLPCSTFGATRHVVRYSRAGEPTRSAACARSSRSAVAVYPALRPRSRCAGRPGPDSHDGRRRRIPGLRPEPFSWSRASVDRHEHRDNPRLAGDRQYVVVLSGAEPGARLDVRAARRVEGVIIDGETGVSLPVVAASGVGSRTQSLTLSSSAHALLVLGLRTN